MGHQGAVQTPLVQTSVVRKFGNAGVLAVVWSTVVMGAYFWHFSSLGWAVGKQLLQGAVPFALGAFCAAFITSVAVQLYGNRRSELRRFATFLFLLLCLTLTITLGLFVLHYRVYFSTWHADFPSVQWSFQTFFTGLASVYLFLGTGLKVFLPLPLICAVGLALYHARKPRAA